MKFSTNSPLNLFIISLCILLSACYTREIENPTSTNFLIDNQSSFALYYERGTGLDLERVQIDPNDITEIEETGTDFGGFVTAEEFFITQKQIYFDTNEDVFLYRDSVGIRIEALQLDANDMLDWELTMLNENNHEYTLIVTDELLN